MVETEELQRTVFSRVQKKKKKSHEPPCTKLLVFAFFFFFCISSNSYPVPPSRVSAQLKHNHIAYFAIYNHINGIWENIYIL